MARSRDPTNFPQNMEISCFSTQGLCLQISSIVSRVSFDKQDVQIQFNLCKLLDLDFSVGQAYS